MGDEYGDPRVRYYRGRRPVEDEDAIEYDAAEASSSNKTKKKSKPKTRSKSPSTKRGRSKTRSKSPSTKRGGSKTRSKSPSNKRGGSKPRSKSPSSKRGTSKSRSKSPKKERSKSPEKKKKGKNTQSRSPSGIRGRSKSPAKKEKPRKPKRSKSASSSASVSGSANKSSSSSSSSFTKKNKKKNKKKSGSPSSSRDASPDSARSSSPGPFRKQKKQKQKPKKKKKNSKITRSNSGSASDSSSGSGSHSWITSRFSRDKSTDKSRGRSRSRSNSASRSSDSEDRSSSPSVDKSTTIKFSPKFRFGGKNSTKVTHEAPPTTVPVFTVAPQPQPSPSPAQPAMGPVTRQHLAQLLEKQRREQEQALAANGGTLENPRAKEAAQRILESKNQPRVNMNPAEARYQVKRGIHVDDPANAITRRPSNTDPRLNVSMASVSAPNKKRVSTQDDSDGDSIDTDTVEEGDDDGDGSFASEQVFEQHPFVLPGDKLVTLDTLLEDSGFNIPTTGESIVSRIGREMYAFVETAKRVHDNHTFSPATVIAIAQSSWAIQSPRGVTYESDPNGVLFVETAINNNQRYIMGSSFIGRARDESGTPEFYVAHFASTTDAVPRAGDNLTFRLRTEGTHEPITSERLFLGDSTHRDSSMLFVQLGARGKAAAILCFSEITKRLSDVYVLSWPAHGDSSSIRMGDAQAKKTIFRAAKDKIAANELLNSLPENVVTLYSAESVRNKEVNLGKGANIYTTLEDIVTGITQTTGLKSLGFTLSEVRFESIFGGLNTAHKTVSINPPSKRVSNAQGVIWTAPLGSDYQMARVLEFDNQTRFSGIKMIDLLPMKTTKGRIYSMKFNVADTDTNSWMLGNFPRRIDFGFSPDLSTLREVTAMNKVSHFVGAVDEYIVIAQRTPAQGGIIGMGVISKIWIIFTV